MLSTEMKTFNQSLVSQKVKTGFGSSSAGNTTVNERSGGRNRKDSMEGNKTR